MSTTTDTTHECPAPACDRRVSRDQFACLTHWRELPGDIKRAIMSAYRSRDTGAHGRAMMEAIRWMRGEPCPPSE